MEKADKVAITIEEKKDDDKEMKNGENSSHDEPISSQPSTLSSLAASSKADVNGKKDEKKDDDKKKKDGDLSLDESISSQPSTSLAAPSKADVNVKKDETLIANESIQQSSTENSCNTTDATSETAKLSGNGLNVLLSNANSEDDEDDDSNEPDTKRFRSNEPEEWFDLIQTSVKNYKKLSLNKVSKLEEDLRLAHENISALKSSLEQEKMEHAIETKKLKEEIDELRKCRLKRICVYCGQSVKSMTFCDEYCWVCINAY